MLNYFRSVVTLSWVVITFIGVLIVYSMFAVPASILSGLEKLLRR